MVYNLDAEQYFIGALLFDATLVKEISVSPEMLSDRHKTILDAMIKADQKTGNADVVAIATELGERLGEIGGIAYLMDLGGAIPTTANLKHYEQFIIDAYKLRKTYDTASEFAKEIQASNRDPILIQNMAQKIQSILENNSTSSKRTWRDTLMDLMDESYADHKEMTGIDTGFNDLNRMTDGFQGNNLIIIGARPSMGKTAFALNIGSNSCMKSDARVDIFSLETPEKRLAKRIISSTGHIRADDMRRMDFDDDTRKKFMDTVGVIDGFDLHIHDQSGITVEQIRAIVREGNRQAVKEGKKHMVIIDYLQLITYQGPLNNSVQQIGHISRQLKIMAGDFNIPVVALSQLSRGVEQRQDKRPMMSDLRESGAIEQDADMIAFLYRDDYYDKESENKNITEVIIAKNRDGAVGTVNLAFIKEYNKFINLDYSNHG